MAALYLLFFLFCFLPSRVTSCGMSTYIDIAHQGITWFKDARNGSDYRGIILKNQDAFIAGNPYPDAVYSSLCYSGKFHSVAEDTHWAPFLNATVNYIRKKYPKPWDQVCQVAKYAWIAWITYSCVCSQPLRDRPPGIWTIFIPWGKGYLCSQMFCFGDRGRGQYLYCLNSAFQFMILFMWKQFNFHLK